MSVLYLPTNMMGDCIPGIDQTDITVRQFTAE